MKTLVVMGTRPEAIKLAPLVKELRQRPAIETKVCLTAQHREMLDQVVEFFNLEIDFDLDVMRAGQQLNQLAARLSAGIDEVLTTYRPDFVVVQGDTTTTFATTWASFHHRIPVGHVEAGLRTDDLYSPWPEEANRRLTSVLASHHYVPTRRAWANLRREGVSEEALFETGNTVIDALGQAIAILENDELKAEEAVGSLPPIDPDKRLILVTSHRRESFGSGMRSICAALETLARRGDLQIILPVHPNPNVSEPIREALETVERIHLVEPLDYPTLVSVLQRSHIVLTDSGGIQEEAPTLGKPVLVMRETTERQEGIDAGTAKLVGTDSGKIVEAAELLLDDEQEFESMAHAANPYGDGQAARRIANAIEEL